MTTTTTIRRKSIGSPSEVREIPHGRIEVVDLGDFEFSRATFHPGWRWSDSVKPIAETESCEFHHRLFVASGTIHVVLDDGTEADLVAGDVADIPPGHDAWVVGDETVVTYDFGEQDADYAKPRS